MIDLQKEDDEAVMIANDDYVVDAIDVDVTRYHHVVDVVKIVVADDDSINVVDLIANYKILDVVECLHLTSKFFVNHSILRFPRLLPRLCFLISQIDARCCCATIADDVDDVLVDFGECAYDDLDCQIVRNGAGTIDIDKVSHHYVRACVWLKLTNPKTLFYNIYN